jgi:two-component sensor histidine kinase
LCEQVKEVFERLDYKMDLTIEMPDKIIDIDTAVPLGLIINELLTNSYKYATKKGESGKILIQLKDLNNGNYVLNYTDSGPGIKQGIDFTNASTLGLRLIRGLSGQLGGKATYNNDGASTFIVEFKETVARHVE